MADNKYSHIVNLDDEDGEGVEIDLNADDSGITIVEDAEVEIPAEKVAKKPAASEAVDEEPEFRPDPSAARVADLENQLRGITAYLNESQRAAARGQSQNAIGEIDGKIAGARAKLKKATEDGDSDAVANAADELADLRIDRRVAAMRAEQEDEAPAQRQQQPQQQPQTNQHARQWAQANSSWFDQEGYEAESLVARGIDAAMARDGWQTNSPGYFRELNKRLAAKLKSIQPVDLPGQRRAEAPPTAAVRGGSTPAPKKGVVRLDRDDIRYMKMLGLDTTNKETLREYARNKQKESN